MNEPIFARALMRKRGRDAFHSGLGRDDHGMNPWADAVTEWHEGWDSAAAGQQVAANQASAEAAA